MRQSPLLVLLLAAAVPLMPANQDRVTEPVWTVGTAQSLAETATAPTGSNTSALVVRMAKPPVIDGDLIEPDRALVGQLGETDEMGATLGVASEGGQAF